MGLKRRGARRAGVHASGGGTARVSSGRATAFVGSGLLLAVVAFAMFEQSARWMLTSATRARFVRDEFEITHLRDQPGRGGFGYGGQIVSSGETFAGGATIMVSLGRLRELEAAGSIPGAREPVYYLPRQAPWTALDYVVRFRVQEPEVFEVDAFGWTIVNALITAGATGLIRKGVRIVKQTTASQSPAMSASRR